MTTLTRDGMKVERVRSRVWSHGSRIMEARKCLALAALSLFFFVLPLKRGRISSEKNVESIFKSFLVRFNKTYGGNETEYHQRFENFKASLKLIEKLNEGREDNGSALYGLTAYSDLSQEEFSRLYLQTNGRSDDRRRWQATGRRGKRKKERREKRSKGIPVPKRFDWREKGVVGEINNQGPCGACWAFSTIATVESMNAIKTKALVPLSVQEMIDCAGNGNRGCEGGDSCSLLKWLKLSKTKIRAEKLYPFLYRTGPCKVGKAEVGVQIRNFSCDSFVGREDELLESLAFHGPVAAAVNALNWQFYLGGTIRYHCPGATEDLNHAVQIVGYDNSGPAPYYIVRNSWGTDFGKDGYLQIAAGGNVCGLATELTVHFTPSSTMQSLMNEIKSSTDVSVAPGRHLMPRPDANEL